jgi:3-hydroxyacyl-[acyl-carrier-protein] dehydratase
VPGDQLRIHVRKIKMRGNLLKFACEALVEDAKVAEAEISAMMVENG